MLENKHILSWLKGRFNKLFKLKRFGILLAGVYVIKRTLD